MGEHKIEEYKKDGYVVEIYPDYEPIDPRTYDTLGTMICRHKRYDLGDNHNLDSFDNVEEIEKYLTEEEDAVITIPLYLYDHSGITMDYMPFHSPWDSGRIGWIYTTKEAILKRFQEDELTDELKDRAREVLHDEVDVYDSYISGEVFLFKIMDRHKCPTCGKCHDKLIESIGGFYDLEYLKEEANAVIDNL